jgi:hypothetical protein
MIKKDKERQRTTKLDDDTSSLLLAKPVSGEVESYVCEETPTQEALASMPSELAAPTPTLTKSMVERAVITFFDNGDQIKQRYKISVRLNLKDEPSLDSPEFIAPLSKDPRTFRRYSAPGTRDDLIQFHDEMRIYVKELGVENKPYFGKFHLNHKQWAEGRAKIQVEPLSYAAVWYDGDGWSGVIKLYDFILNFDLFANNITHKQQQKGVKCAYLWQNPKYSRENRPLTWAEQRSKK